MSILDELERIEKKLKRGEDVRREFWLLAGRIKRSNVRDDDILSRVARIRDEMFDRKVLFGFRAGFSAFSFLFILSNTLLYLIAFKPMPDNLKLVSIAAVELAALYTSFLVGRCLSATLTGIEVDGFYRYTPLEFGVKINYLSYLKASQRDRVLLYSGAIVLEHITMLAHTLFLLSIKSSCWIIPAFFLIANLPFSYLMHRAMRTGELHRLIREYRILREVRAKANK
ncbi:hypothetical protein [Geoglobus acetivorans]|uniref:Glycosyl-4,4'-diaponeurosporenoate acyltransferase n=1 Tax=Geoglobus acetivorans TaxID=565033 RepID=A0A0A7GIJ9_GEOAI|nr:hypothetical protein GACE_1711 [Geoglobus acetivorans]